MSTRHRSRSRDRKFHCRRDRDRDRNRERERERERERDRKRHIHFHHHYHNHYHQINNNHNHYHNRDDRDKKERDKKEKTVTTTTTTTTTECEGACNLKNIKSIYRNRYIIGKKLGQGTFGLVIECIDNKRKIKVAVKIVRSVRRYLDAAEIEVEILNKLDKLDIYKNSLIIRLYKSFRCLINNVEHSCLVFEKCGRSLYDYIKKNKYCGFPLFIIAIIGYQLFHSISFCHLNKLTHTDLKLENILFVSDQYKYNNNYNIYLPKNNNFEIRLIDFGGATFENDHHSSIINTRQYRGPEVILSLSWSYPSDIWSIGCILSELFCGELLFATHNDYEHLQLIKKILNIKSFPKSMINNQNIKLLNINHNDNINNNVNIKYIEKCKTLKQIIKNDLLFDLINQCLQIDPNKRITALQAKKHPFFQQFINNDNNSNNNYDNFETENFKKIFNLIHR